MSSETKKPDGTGRNPLPKGIPGENLGVTVPQTSGLSSLILEPGRNPLNVDAPLPEAPAPSESPAPDEPEASSGPVLPPEGLPDYDTPGHPNEALDLDEYLASVPTTSEAPKTSALDSVNEAVAGFPDVNKMGLPSGTPAPANRELPDPSPTDWRENRAQSRSQAEELAAMTVDRMIGLESGGKANAYNRASGAAGVGQFLESTWINMMNTHRPDLVRRLSRAELLDKRFDPVLNRQMTVQFAQDNANYLQSRGLPVNEDTIYLAHHFGAAGAAKIISAPDGTPMRNLISANALDKNPYLRDLTVAGLINNHRRRSGKAPIRDTRPGFSQAEASGLDRIYDSKAVRLEADQAVYQVREDALPKPEGALAALFRGDKPENRPTGNDLYNTFSQAPQKSEEIEALTAAQNKQEIDDNNVTFGQKFDAAQNDTLIMDAFRFADRLGLKADPNWNSKVAEAELAKQMGKAWNAEDYNYLINETISREDFYTQMAQINIRHEDDITLSRGGTLSTLAAGGAAALVDPFSYVLVGGTEIAAARLIGVGYRASVVGGAVGELAYVGGQQALGRYHTTPMDYITSAALGAAFNGATDLVTGRARRATLQQDIVDGVERLQEVARNNEAVKEAYTIRARNELGDDATPDQIQGRIDEYVADDILNAMNIQLAPVPDAHRVISHENNLLLRYSDAVAEEMDPMEARKLIPEYVDLVTDNKKAAAYADIIDQAKRTVEEAGPIDTTRVDRAGYLGPLASAGTVFLKSENPVVKAIGIRLSENAIGAVRNRTASIAKYTLERVYRGNFENVYETGFRTFLRRQNKTTARTLFDSRARVEFEDGFHQHIENIRNGIENTGPYKDIFDAMEPEIRRAFDIMRVHQKRTGVRGADLLPDTSEGYMPILVDPVKLRSMSTKDRTAYVQAMARNLLDGTRHLGAEALTPNQAEGIAKMWMEVQWTKANGSQHIASTPWSRRGAEEIETAIRASEMDELDKEAAINAIKKGLANHMKRRIDRNLNTTFKGENGTEVRLSDIMVKDPITLLRRQAARVSGEVALKMWGVDGRAGLDQLKEAAKAYGPKPATLRELEAIDQFGAEMLGMPYGDQTPTFVSNLMSATRISRLGGLAWAQTMESANMIHALGVIRSAKIVPEFRRVLREIKTIARTGKFEGTFLSDYESIAGTVGTDNYKSGIPAEALSVYTPAYSANDASLIGSGLRKIENAQNRFTMQHAIMSVQQRFSTEQIIHKMAKYIRDGMEDRALADMGITPELAKRLRDDIGSWTKFDARGRLQEFKPSQAKDKQAMSEMLQSIERGSKQIIQESFAGERSKWVHNWVFKLMTQFRTYPLQATEKQLIRQFSTHGAWRGMGLLLGGMSVALPIQLARALFYSQGMSPEDREKYLERQLSPAALAYNSLGYVSQMGLGSEILDLGAGLAGFEIARTQVGKRSGLVSQTIPGAGYIEDAALGLNDLVRKGDPSRLVGLVPGASAWQLRPIINMIKSEVKPSDYEE